MKRHRRLAAVRDSWRFDPRQVAPVCNGSFEEAGIASCPIGARRRALALQSAEETWREVSRRFARRIRADHRSDESVRLSYRRKQVSEFTFVESCR
jgi:hypothetical protein